MTLTSQYWAWLRLVELRVQPLMVVVSKTMSEELRERWEHGELTSYEAIVLHGKYSPEVEEVTTRYLEAIQGASWCPQDIKLEVMRGNAYEQCNRFFDWVNLWLGLAVYVGALVDSSLKARE